MRGTGAALGLGSVAHGAGRKMKRSEALAKLKDRYRRREVARSPGGGRVMACLKDKQSELSPACQAALPVMERCAQEVKSACGAAGKRGMRECLRSQSDKISPECRSLAPQR